MTSDASGNATWQAPATTQKVAFYVSGPAQGGLQNLPNGSWYKLHCATEEYDPGNNYKLYSETPSSTFIAPAAGLYQFQASASTHNDGGSGLSLAMRIMLKRNGVNTELADNYSGGDGEFSFTLITELSRIIYLNAGEQIWVELRGETDNGTNPTLIPYRTYFTGFLVQ